MGLTCFGFFLISPFIIVGRAVLASEWLVIVDTKDLRNVGIVVRVLWPLVVSHMTGRWAVTSAESLF